MATACLGGLPALISRRMFCSNAFLEVDLTSGMSATLPFPLAFLVVFVFVPGHGQQALLVEPLVFILPLALPWAVLGPVRVTPLGSEATDLPLVLTLRFCDMLAPLLEDLVDDGHIAAVPPREHDAGAMNPALAVEIAHGAADDVEPLWRQIQQVQYLRRPGRPQRQPFHDDLRQAPIHEQGLSHFVHHKSTRQYHLDVSACSR